MAVGADGRGPEELNAEPLCRSRAAPPAEAVGEVGTRWDSWWICSTLLISVKGTESKTASSPIRAKERTSLLQTTRRVCQSLGARGDYQGQEGAFVEMNRGNKSGKMQMSAETRVVVGSGG